MFCEKCGARMAEGMKFCQECGAPARSNAQGAVPSSPKPTPPSQSVAVSPQPPPPPQVRQVSQDTAPMPPIPPAPQPQLSQNTESMPSVPPVPPPPAYNQQESCQQPGQVPSSGSRKGLFLGLGIAALVILLAGGGFAAYKFGLMDKFKAAAGVATEPAQENMVATESQEEPKADGTSQAADDPIRASKVMGVTNVASKLDDKYINKYLQILQGDWYDKNGNKLVTFNDRKINGCEIVDIYDMAGGGGKAAATFRLKEDGQEWDVRISWDISKSPRDFIAVDGGQTMFRSQNAESVETAMETVEGVYLGMPPEQVEQKLGKPSRILSKEHPLEVGGNTFVSGWLYADKGLLVSFRNGSADGIALLRGSPLRFGKSGLNCSNSLDEFEKAYNMKRKPRVPTDRSMVIPCPIDNGQTLFFGMDMDYVLLSIYAT